MKWWNALAEEVGTLSGQTPSIRSLEEHALVIGKNMNPLLCLSVVTEKIPVNANEIYSHINLPSARIVWEDQWYRNQQAVLSRIQSLAGTTQRIHARATQIVELTREESDDFLYQHHLAGAVKGKIRLGLFWKNNLVAIAVFGKPCPVEHSGKTWRSIELRRFSNLSGHTVVGGMSKLMKAAAAKAQANDIMTYADLDWSDESTWLKLGFVETGRLNGQTLTVDTTTWQRKYPGDEQSEGVKIINRGSIKYNWAI